MAMSTDAQIEYRLADGLMKERTLEWVVYGGSDGSVLVFKPKTEKWVRLKQTWDSSKAYWKVTFHSKPECDVQRVICYAFQGDPPSLTEVLACHGNGDPSDNRASNVDWGDHEKNAKQREEHRDRRKLARRDYIGSKIRLTCLKHPEKTAEWEGILELPNQEPNQEPPRIRAPTAVGVVQKLLLRLPLTAEKTEATFRSRKHPQKDAYYPDGFSIQGKELPAQHFEKLFPQRLVYPAIRPKLSLKMSDS